MRKLIWATVAALALSAGSGRAQVSFDPSAPKAIASILTWKGEQQATGFRDIEHIFKTHTVKRGKAVHPLPVAARQIAPTFTYKDKTWTIGDYMAANRVSG